MENLGMEKNSLPMKFQYLRNTSIMLMILQRTKFSARMYWKITKFTIFLKTLLFLLGNFKPSRWLRNCGLPLLLHRLLAEARQLGGGESQAAFSAQPLVRKRGSNPRRPTKYGLPVRSSLSSCKVFAQKKQKMSRFSFPSYLFWKLDLPKRIFP